MWNKTQTVVDDAEDLTFEKALDKTIEKEKPLIYRAFANAKELCENENVWCLMLQEAEDDNVDVLEAFNMYIQYYRCLKYDKVFQAITKTLNLVRENGINFEQALNFAVQENKSLILQRLSKPTSRVGLYGTMKRKIDV